MSKNNQKTSRFPSPSHLLPWALLLLFGAAAGYLGAMLVDRMGLTGGGIAAMVLGLAAGFFVQLVLHEGGHLAAGLAAGYGFVSFRVGSWMVIRRAGRLRLVRYRLSGTGGQCLLSPRKDSRSLPTTWADRWPTCWSRLCAWAGDGSAGSAVLSSPPSWWGLPSWACTWA